MDEYDLIFPLYLHCFTSSVLAGEELLLFTCCSEHRNDVLSIKNSIYALPPLHRFSPSGSMVAVTERYRSKSESPGRMDEPKQPSSQVGRSRHLQVNIGLEGEGDFVVMKCVIFYICKQ